MESLNLLGMRVIDLCMGQEIGVILGGGILA